MNVVFMGFVVMTMAFLYASGEIKKDASTGQGSVEFNETLQYMMTYTLFGMLWGLQFIAGVGLMTTAGSIASYYWQRDDMPRSPIKTAIKRTWRYHVGSIALGSFIVAVVQFVRLILEYINRKTKNAQEGSAVLKYFMCVLYTGPIRPRSRGERRSLWTFAGVSLRPRLAFNTRPRRLSTPPDAYELHPDITLYGTTSRCCARYCMWYLERVLKYINRNAYILVAVKGYSFCFSAISAVKLLILNAMRVATVNVIGDFLTALGKLVVAGTCTFIGFLYLDQDQYTDPTSDSYISSPVLPLIFIALIAFFLADIFLGLYEMAIDTILLSFCEDCGTANGPNFAPPLLMSALGKSLPAKKGKKVKPAYDDDDD
eukprot:31541-Pelagococcus_subviridis.AAC.2